MASSVANVRASTHTTLPSMMSSPGPQTLANVPSHLCINPHAYTAHMDSTLMGCPRSPGRRVSSWSGMHPLGYPCPIPPGFSFARGCCSGDYCKGSEHRKVGLLWHQPSFSLTTIHVLAHNNARASEPQSLSIQQGLAAGLKRLKGLLVNDRAIT